MRGVNLRSRVEILDLVSPHILMSCLYHRIVRAEVLEGGSNTTRSILHAQPKAPSFPLYILEEQY
ncbi:unnamed protein product [Penicillium roqueforti FM164]|uniref:Genomic scaffold, ProqFM164S02 n=1 Tax=Penicillium roqueforti (strain FM164) TaxID=1365484 RepID=W6Q6E8_PENRF|nr:unnamed protein product [Penicillium roqueforti FM164]